MVGAISANSFQLLGQSPCSSANAESLGKWLMAMLCCVVATVGYFGACILSACRDGVARILGDVRGLVSGVLHSLGNVGTGALSAPFNTETLLGTV